MTSRHVLHASLALVVLLACQQPRSAPPRADAPHHDGSDALLVVPDFELTDTRGVEHELYERTDQRALVLFSHGLGCPIARLQTPRLQELAAELGPRGVSIWFLNSDASADAAEVRAEVDAWGIDLPVLLDGAQSVTRALEIDRMAEAVVVDTRTWTIAYRGLVDDRVGYGTQRAEAREHYLRDALLALLDGRPIETPRTVAKGCRIHFEHD
jgi:peroxiredoxin